MRVNFILDKVSRRTIKDMLVHQTQGHDKTFISFELLNKYIEIKDDEITINLAEIKEV